LASIKPTRHLEWIDFLRGLSAVAVILFHVRVDLWVGWNVIHANPNAYSNLDRATAWLSILTPFFGSAVMLFFLVSGFCVHYPYAGSGRILELKTYSARRFFRIYPPYLGAVVFSIIVELLIGHRLGNQPSSLATVLRSMFMVQNYGVHPGQMTANPSLWSLPVEVELYIVYPLFYWLLMRFGGRRALIVAAAVSLAALGLSLNSRLDFVFNIPGHFAVYWIIWCAGALLAEGVKRDRLPVWKPWMSAGMAAALLLALCVEVRKLPLEVQHLTWALFYFTIISWGLTRHDLLLSWSVPVRNAFVFLGMISYSLYLIHFPLFRLCGVLWVSHFGAKPADFLISLLFCVLAIPVAYLFYVTIEAPSHRFAQSVGRRKKSLPPHDALREPVALP